MNDVPASFHHAGDHHGAWYDVVLRAVSSGARALGATPSWLISVQRCSTCFVCTVKSVWRPEPTAARVAPAMATITARLAMANGDVRMGTPDGSGTGRSRATVRVRATRESLRSLEHRRPRRPGCSHRRIR